MATLTLLKIPSLGELEAAGIETDSFIEAFSKNAPTGFVVNVRIAGQSDVDNGDIEPEELSAGIVVLDEWFIRPGSWCKVSA